MPLRTILAFCLFGNRCSIILAIRIERSLLWTGGFCWRGKYIYVFIWLKPNSAFISSTLDQSVGDEKTISLKHKRSDMHLKNANNKKKRTFALLQCQLLSKIVVLETEKAIQIHYMKGKSDQSQQSNITSLVLSTEQSDFYIYIIVNLTIKFVRLCLKYRK